jgi:hypothetical protein
MIHNTFCLQLQPVYEDSSAGNSHVGVEMMNAKEEHGLLILEQQKHLQAFEGYSLRHFGATIFSGQCGRLLGKMRRQEVIHDLDLIEVFGADVGAYDRKRVDSLLQELDRKGAITIYREGNKIRKIEESMNTESEILRLTQEMWEENSPTLVEEVSKEAILFSGHLPRLHDELYGHLESSGLDDSGIELGTDLSTEFGMLIRKEGIEGVGNVNIRGAVHSLKGLNEDLKVHVDRTLKTVSKAQGVSLDTLQIPSDLLRALHRLGLINIERVETTGGVKKDFAFTPAMWGNLGFPCADEQEHVRALLSCVHFGRICPTEVDGKVFPIKYPVLYLKALRTKGRVGPSTMIGTDYLILVREGIVKAVPSWKSGQWDMVLIKDDVADRAYKVMKTGIGADVDIEPRPESLTQYGVFSNSVQTRLEPEVRAKQKSSVTDYADKEMLKLLRGEK